MKILLTFVCINMVWEKCAPSHSFGPVSRNHYLFHYVISGTGTLMAGNSHKVTQNYQLKPRQGL